MLAISFNANIQEYSFKHFTSSVHTDMGMDDSTSISLQYVHINLIHVFLLTPAIFAGSKLRYGDREPAPPITGKNIKYSDRLLICLPHYAFTQNMMW